MKARVKSLIKYLLLILAFGAVYVFLWWLGLDIKCPLHELTGLLCPACGISRMLVSLIKLDISGAAFYNLGGLVLLPLWLAVAISYAYGYVKHGKTDFKPWYRAVFILSIAVFAVYGILRNVTDLGLSPSDDIEFFNNNFFGGT